MVCSFYLPPGSDLWKALGQPPTRFPILDDDDAEAGPGSADGPDETFFSVAAKPMTGLTLLGETSMHQVDFFVQVFNCVSEDLPASGKHDESSVVSIVPCDNILVAPCFAIA